MKDKINNLSISEELKQQLCQIMLNSSDSEQDSDNELAHLENEELFESNTETSSDSENECACQVNDLKICVLTKEESLIIDLIDKIEDPDKKKEVQESYISLATAGPSNPQPVVTNVRQPVENYSFKTIVNKMNDKIHKKEPTLNDLQCEVHDVKEELRELKIGIDRVIAQKWYAMITIVIDRTYTFAVEGLIDTGAELNCINEGILRKLPRFYIQP
ncbi:unnamed protein product [Prunus armeniaca]|uniref:Uncharacterized protein n=1 Tax=Prunus armeniaca TaxID=36596 RepID=A0A6J5VL87_PRUAR|nr:unnamed protein product [Prunus armeniaca]